MIYTLRECALPICFVTMTYMQIGPEIHTRCIFHAQTFIKMLSQGMQCPRPRFNVGMHHRHPSRHPPPHGPPPLRCKTPKTAQEPSRQAETAEVSSAAAEPPSQSNTWLAVGAVSVAAAAVLVGRGLDGGPAITRLQRASVPLEAALANGRPTVLEFYADWCAVCNELAPATLEVLCKGVSWLFDAWASLRGMIPCWLAAG